MKVWNHIQNLKPPRSLKPPRVPKSKIKDEQIPPKVCPKCKGDHEEKDCTKFLFKKGKEEIISPKIEKQVSEANKSEKKSKEGKPIGKDTEKWVKEQNKLFEKEREKRQRKEQKEGIPVKFEPIGPETFCCVRIRWYPECRTQVLTGVSVE